jgi:glycosyltransferase involved in cell wall biosynthesis
MTDNVDNNRRIALVSNSAWSVYNFRLDVIRHFIQQGYEVLVFAAKDDYAALLERAGCKFVPLDFNNRMASPLLDLKFYLQLKRLYRRHKPSFIFHYVVKPNIYGSMAAAACGIPSVAVITGLGYPFAARNWLYHIVKYLYRKALKRTKEVWFLNNEDAKIFINEKIVPINKIQVLPGEGVNTSYFAPTKNESRKTHQPFTFLMSTRLLKSKGVSLYADAARILKRKGFNIQCLLVGFFEQHHPDSISHENLDRWETEGLISYKGFANDVRVYIRQADCFIFPSFYFEGVPRCLMEAASMQVPIITSHNRGCNEVVSNNVNGFICNPNDPFDLAAKMEKMLNLPIEERIRMGINGRLLVENKFNIQKVVAIYSNTLKTDRPE